jgi:transposase
MVFMGRQFLPVDRDTPALLPVNMLDWVPEDHVVRLVIDTVEAVTTPELAARLVPAVRSRKGRRRYDPVMLLTLLTYSYLRGVLSSRAIEDRCRYDVTFRVACGKHVPDHTTIARFRKRACAQDELMEELFYAVLRVCAAAGLGRLTVIAGDGVKIGANASKEANRTEAGLRKLAVTIMAQAARAEEQDGRREKPGTGEDLFGGEALPGGWADPRSRLGRVRECLAGFAAQREAAEAARRAQGQAWLDALAAGKPVTKPPAAVAVEAARIGLEQAVAAQQAKIDEWDRKRAAGGLAGCKPVPVGVSRRVARQRDRLERAEAAAAAQPPEDQAGEAAGTEGKKDNPRPVRNVTDPASALMPVRGGGLKQGYNCQDIAADDRLLLGGFASACAADTVHAARLEAVAVKGAQVVAGAHADPGHDVAGCHARMCTGHDAGDPGHDAAACHAQMTGAPGVIVFDAGYCSQTNLTAEGSADRLIATGNRRSMGKAAADNPATGPPPPGATATQQMDHKLRTSEGRAAYKRRAPDIEGVHASIEDVIGLRRFSMRGLALATGEFLLAGLCHNLLLLSRLP